MKLLQKLAAVGMAACMLFSALSGQGAPSVKAYQIDSNAPDEEVAGIYADTIHAAAGETVPVSVSINNNDGFASVGASIIYPAALTPVAGSDAAKPEFEVGSQFSGPSGMDTRVIPPSLDATVPFRKLHSPIKSATNSLLG